MNNDNENKCDPDPKKIIDIGESYRKMRLVDIASTKYTVEWQRLNSIQQSAGIYIAALAIVFSVLFTLISSNHNTQESLMLHSNFINCLFLIIPVCVAMLISVTWPKIIMDIPYSSHIDRKLCGNIEDDTAKLLDMFDKVNKNVSSLGEMRLRRYRISLKLLSIALIVSILGLGSYFYRIEIPSEYCHEVNCLLLFIMCLVILLSFIWKDSIHDGTKT